MESRAKSIQQAQQQEHQLHDRFQMMNFLLSGRHQPPQSSTGQHSHHVGISNFFLHFSTNHMEHQQTHHGGNSGQPLSTNHMEHQQQTQIVNRQSHTDSRVEESMAETVNRPSQQASQLYNKTFNSLRQELIICT